MDSLAQIFFCIYRQGKRNYRLLTTPFELDIAGFE